MNCDIVIAGGGTAGCYIAAKLPSNLNIKIVERGSCDASISFYKVDGEQGFVTGVGLGGCSAINASVYFRPTQADIQGLTNVTTWTEEKIKHNLNSVESSIPIVNKGPSPDDTDFSSYWKSILHSAGIPILEELNIYEGHREAIGPPSKTVTSNGRFSSKELLDGNRTNIEVLTNSICSQVIFDDGRKAVGVMVMSGSQSYFIKANLVILACGAIETPKLLQISGIGPEAHLNSLNMPLIMSNNHVGQGLQDHFQIRISVREKNIIQHAKYWSAFIKSSASLPKPDFIIQTWTDSKENTFNASIALVRATTEGIILAKSCNVAETPQIVFPITENVIDMERFANVVSRLSSMLEAGSCYESESSDIRELLKKAVKQKNAHKIQIGQATAQFTSWIHFWGSCKIGQVVDDNFQVIGCQNLMVADLSVWPSSISVNSQSVAYLVADAATQVIAQKFQK